MTRHGTKRGGGRSTASRSSPSRSRDAELESLLRLPTVDVANRLNAMLEAERRPHYRCRDYLDDCPSVCSRRSGRRPRREGIDPAARARIVQWLYDCVDYLELSRECVAVASSLVDRFLSSAPENRGDYLTKRERRHRRAARDALGDGASYQLLAVAALLIAAKQVDGHRALGAVDADVLARVGRGSCSPEEILDAEALLLDALDWRVCQPTALGAAGHLVALLGGDDDGRLGSVLDFARLQVELAVADYPLSTLRRPSGVALAAVLNAVELLDFSSRERRRFARTLRELTGVDARSREVGATRDELRRVFDRRSDGVVSKAAGTKEQREGGSVPSVAGSARPDDGVFTPRSQSSRRGRGVRPRPSPTGVDAGVGRIKLEP